MLWHMLSTPGILSPLARPSSMRRRATSVRVKPRSSRCWRSHAPSFSGIKPSFLRARSRAAADTCWGVVSDDEVVGKASFGALDEGFYFSGFEDEGWAVGVGGLAESDAAAGEFLGFEAGAAVVAPWFAPVVGTEAGGGHAVA